MFWDKLYMEFYLVWNKPKGDSIKMTLISHIIKDLFNSFNMEYWRTLSVNQSGLYFQQFRVFYLYYNNHYHFYTKKLGNEYSVYFQRFYRNRICIIKVIIISLSTFGKKRWRSFSLYFGIKGTSILNSLFKSWSFNKLISALVISKRWNCCIYFNTVLRATPACWLINNLLLPWVCILSTWRILFISIVLFAIMITFVMDVYSNKVKIMSTIVTFYSFLNCGQFNRFMQFRKLLYKLKFYFNKNTSTIIRTIFLYLLIIFSVSKKAHYLNHF